jgi:hypothetical protein
LLDAALLKEADAGFDYLSKGSSRVFAMWAEDDELEHECQMPQWVGVFFKGGPWCTFVTVRGNVCFQEDLKEGMEAFKNNVFVGIV